MYVVLDRTPLSDNYDLISGPFNSRADAIDHANNLIEWYKTDIGVDLDTLTSDSTRILGDHSDEYIIFLVEKNGYEHSRIRVAPVKNPDDYDLS